jgi:hypothetical protein
MGGIQMIDIGTYVWHNTVKANGKVVEIRDWRSGRDQTEYLIQFSWAKKCKTEGGKYIGFQHPYRKWQWATAGEIDASCQPPEKKNKVSVVGGNFLDNLIRSTCEFPRRRPDDGSDIILAYGIGNTRCPEHILVLNRNLMVRKYDQQQELGHEMGIESRKDRPPITDDWIIKPIWSIGGKGIRSAKGDTANWKEYYQRKFNKVREFRAHVFLWCDEPCVLIQEKKIADKNQLCWNEKQGSTFFSPYAPEHRWFKLDREDPGLRERISDLGTRALKAIHYDFGGIDIGMDAEGNLKIFEVNSRMGVVSRSGPYAHTRGSCGIFMISISTSIKQKGGHNENRLLSKLLYIEDYQPIRWNIRL